MQMRRWYIYGHGSFMESFVSILRFLSSSRYSTSNRSLNEYFAASIVNRTKNFTAKLVPTMKSILVIVLLCALACEAPYPVENCLSYIFRLFSRMNINTGETTEWAAYGECCLTEPIDNMNRVTCHPERTLVCDTTGAGGATFDVANSIGHDGVKSYEIGICGPAPK